MKTLLSNDSLVLLTRLFIGLMFVFASFDKIANPAGFAKSIDNYKVISGVSSMAIATVLPWVELLCGFALIRGAHPKASSLLVSLLMFGFTVAVLSALLRGLDIACGCFTQDPAVGKITWMKVVENSGVFLLSLFLFFSNSDKFTLDYFLKSWFKD